MFTRFGAGIVLLFCVGAATAEEQIDNPEFVNWSKSKSGASVTLKTTSTVSGVTTEVVRTVTLVEVGADKLVIEEARTTKIKDAEVKSPAVKREVPKSIKAPPGFKAEDFKGGKRPGVYEEGTETLKVGGTEIKTTWYKSKVEVGGVKTESKTWISDEVPGRVVKMDSTTTGSLAIASKIEVVEFKKP